MVVALSNVAQTTAQNTTESVEHIGGFELSAVECAFDYAFSVAVVTLIVGIPLIVRVRCTSARASCSGSFELCMMCFYTEGGTR